jgi:ribosome-associated protein
MPDDLPINEAITVPGDELSYRFTTSGGPGGQNVNKVHTRVELRWILDTTSAPIPHDAMQRLRGAAGRRLSSEGVLLLVSDRHRTQLRNIGDARERLVELIRGALPRPKPRRKTKVSRAAKKRRVKAKRQRSEVKKGRARVRGDGS